MITTLTLDSTPRGRTVALLETADGQTCLPFWDTPESTAAPREGAKVILFRKTRDEGAEGAPWR